MDRYRQGAKSSPAASVGTPRTLTPQEFIDATENFIQWCSPSLDMLLWVDIRRSNGAAVAMKQPVCCYELAARKDQLP